MGFVDDLPIGAMTNIDLLDAIMDVLSLSVRLNCTVIPTSIAFGTVISALGKIVGIDGISIADRHKLAIEALQVPSTPKEMKSLFAFLSFRGHIPQFSARTRWIRLSMVGKASNPQRCSEELEDLKSAVKQAVSIRRPPPGGSLILETDFSKDGLGCVLLWENGTSLLPCRLLSRRTTESERKVCPLEGEALAIKWALEELSADVLGVYKVLCITDHQPLEKLMMSDVSYLNISETLKLKICHIQIHGVKVKYRPGAKNVLAEATARTAPLVSLTH